MKQYTTPEQTAKLIELGFEKPKSISSIIWDAPKGGGIMINANSIEFDHHYSICDLIDVLGVHLSSIYYIGIEWFVNAEGIERRREELIDALYDMVVKLKEEEKI